MKKQYNSPSIQKMTYSIDVAFAKFCGMTNYPGSNCWPGAYEYK